VQYEGEVRGCLSVHATFTEYGDAGKKWRFLEAKLWAVLPPSYYTEGRYLTFIPPRAPPDPMPCKDGEGVYIPGRVPSECGGEDPHHGLPRKMLGKEIMWTEGLKRSIRLRANVDLMSTQVHALRDALAIARVLNRTLIMPHFDCLCDRSEYPDVMPSCVYYGAPRRLKIPFRCSTHFVTDTHKLQLMSTEPSRFGMQPHKFDGFVVPPLRMRTHSFLNDPRTDPAITSSIVDVHQEGGEGEGSSGGGSSGEGGGRRAVLLPKGATNVQVLKRLGSLQSARVLRLSEARGSFSGWVSERREAQIFNTMMDYYLYRGAWCCTSRYLGGDSDNGRVYLKKPPPLTQP